MNKKSTPNKALHYRPDIDGLRAVAVIPVILFHAGFQSFSGGFLGVDVFFVISGFLITSIIYSDLKNGTFSITKFYERRARRILPALYFVMLVCLPFAWFWLMPAELEDFSESLSAVALFVSNFLFWKETGYFDTAAELKPLLHTWSLAVEEQYYIIFPILMMIAFKYRKTYLLQILTFLSLISFAIATWSGFHSPTAGFFLLPMRAWELLIGAIGALYLRQGTLQFSNQLMNFLSSLGLMLILFSIFFIDKKSAYPGVYNLVPTVGTILIILFTLPGGLTYRILSHRILVGIGLISYSAYLWHQPLFAFARSAITNDLKLTIQVFISILSIALAYLSWSFIEKPFRNPKKTSRKFIFTFSGIGIIFWIGVGLIGEATIEYSGRFGKEIHIGDIGHLPYHEYVSRNFYECAPPQIANESLKWEAFTRCAQSKPNIPVDTVLIGDSHSEHLFLGLAEELKNQNVAFYIRNSKPLLINSDFKSIFDFILPSTSIKTVILSMAWADRLDQPGKNNNFISDLTSTIQAITNSGKTLYLTDDVPRFTFGPVTCKWSRKFLNNTNCEMPANQNLVREEIFLDVSQKIVSDLPKTKIIHLRKHLCNETKCSMARDGQILYRDDNHLNIIGSKYISKKIIEENPELQTPNLRR